MFVSPGLATRLRVSQRRGRMSAYLVRFRRHPRRLIVLRLDKRDFQANLVVLHYSYAEVAETYP